MRVATVLWISLALAACGETQAAFERRSIPPEPRRFAALGVAFRSKYTRYSSLTRLVSRTPRRSRRSPEFHHRLLAAGGQSQVPAQEVQIGGKQAAETLLARVLEHREAVRRLEGGLTFRQLITTEALDEARDVVSTANALYEYEPVFGRHLWKLLELDGEEIGGRRFRREERRYRRAVEAAKEEAEEDRLALERQDPDYEVLPKNGMDLFYKIVKDALELEMFEGALFRGATWRGRPMQIVRFRPRAGFEDAPNRMMSVVSKCEGELWVDPENLQIARVRTVLQQDENFVAGLFGRLHRGTSAEVESQLDGRIWLPQRVTMTVDARMYFIRRIRRRVHYDFLGFRSLPPPTDR